MKKDDNSPIGILKSTGLIGGSKIITILISIVQTKIVAVLLGPMGIGIVSLFNSAISLIKSLTHFGIGFSAVRDISEAVATNNAINISKSIITLRRWIWISGIIGIILTIIFSKKLSIYTFGDDSKTLELFILSSTILFGAIAGGQMAILRGYRKIGTLAKANIYGSILGFIITVPIYFFFGVNGIIPVLILTSLSNLILSWWFSHSIAITPIKISFFRSIKDGAGMIKLGLFTVFTGFVSAGTIYLIKIIISNKAGVDAVGFFAVGSTLSVTYLGILLDAMATDYFPRLSAINQDNSAINKLVNNQTLITLLLGTPLVIGMYAFLEFLITIFYSSKFMGAVALIQWMLLGVFLRLITWPLGYVFLAKAKGKIFMFTQSVWNGIYLIITFLAWPYFDFEVVGIAFSFAYLIGYLINLFLIKKITSFNYDPRIIKILLFIPILVVVSFLVSKYLEPPVTKYLILGLILITSLFIAYQILENAISLKSKVSDFITDKFKK